jgi:hypothetical protein
MSSSSSSLPSVPSESPVKTFQKLVNATETPYPAWAFTTGRKCLIFWYIYYCLIPRQRLFFSMGLSFIESFVCVWCEKRTHAQEILKHVQGKPMDLGNIYWIWNAKKLTCALLVLNLILVLVTLPKALKTPAYRPAKGSIAGFGAATALGGKIH